MSNCYLCNSTNFIKVKGTVRDYPYLNILKCKECGLVFLDSFDHIDETYYENSRMLSEAHLTIDNWEKENFEQNNLRAKRIENLIENKIVIDFGCGEGGFLKKIKPIVKACAGVEKSQILRKRIVEGFKIQMFKDLDDIKGSNIEVITMFHVIEHLKDPMFVLKNLSEHLIKNGRIYIETPNSNDALLSLYESKDFSNFTYWGCHLYLFSEDTLKTLVEKAGFIVEKIEQIQRYPLSNHLYWLAKKQPKGHKIWDFLNDKELNEKYEKTLANLGICDTLTITIRKE
jgi:2-polyprenyl-3-methyl-5-hydroxy-6-metoxy-1,4-benzoquinol methylase